MFYSVINKFLIIFFLIATLEASLLAAARKSTDELRMTVIHCSRSLALEYERYREAGVFSVDSEDILTELAGQPLLTAQIFAIKLSAPMVGLFEGFIRYWGHLVRLDAPFCELTSIPSWVAALRNLRHLDFFGNDKIVIPDDFRFSPHLEYLALDGCALSKIPIGVLYLKNLKFLGLSFNDWGLPLPPALSAKEQKGDLHIR